MKKKSVILLILIVIFCSAAIIAYKFWNKSFKDPLKGNAIKVTAIQLFNDFNSNEAQAQQKYVANMDDKILEISGEITEVANNEDGEIYYMLKTDDEMFGVKCVMDNDNAANKAKVGDNVTIRGFCVGYNMDVIVRRCKIVK